MPRSALTLLALLAIGAAHPARAADRGPACREPSVVDEISREVSARSYYGSIDPDLVSEQPTADPLVVNCQVCVLYGPYDTPRRGERPVQRCVVRAFQVRILPAGFVVRAMH